MSDRRSRAVPQHAIRTGTIIHVYIVAEVLHIIVGCDANIHAEGVGVEGRCGVRDVTGILEGVIGGAEQESLLWVHAPGFAGRNMKEGIVEGVHVVQEVPVRWVVGAPGPG